jgi:hypothetical protein
MLNTEYKQCCMHSIQNNISVFKVQCVLISDHIMYNFWDCRQKIGNKLGNIHRVQHNNFGRFVPFSLIILETIRLTEEVYIAQNVPHLSLTFVRNIFHSNKYPDKCVQKHRCSCKAPVITNYNQNKNGWANFSKTSQYQTSCKSISCFLRCNMRSRDSIVGIVTDYGLDDQGVGVQVPVGVRIFTFPCCPDWLWGPPNLLSNWYFPGG